MALDLTLNANITGIDPLGGNGPAVMNVDLRGAAPNQGGSLSVQTTWDLISAAVAGGCTIEITQ